VPVTNLARDAGRLQILENVSRSRTRPRFGNVGDLERRAGAAPRVDGRGLAVADFDNDGTPDIAVNSIGGPLALLRNNGRHGHWLEVSFSKFSPGAVVTAVLPEGRRIVREVHAGSSYLSSEDPRVQLGLGQARRVRLLTVRFPDGARARLANVAADRVVVVHEPAATTNRDTTEPVSYVATGCRPHPAATRSAA